MGKSSAPPAPDFAGLAREQGKVNRDTALFNANLNRVTQSGPQGSQTWSLRPGADPNNPQPGDYIQTTTLSPGAQAQFDAQQQFGTGISQLANQYLPQLQGQVMGGQPNFGALPAFRTSSGRVGLPGGQQFGSPGGPAAPAGPKPALDVPLQGDYLAAVGRGEYADPRVAGFSPGSGTSLGRNDGGQLTTNAMRVGGGAAARGTGGTPGSNFLASTYSQPGQVGMNGLGLPGGSNAPNSGGGGFGGVQGVSQGSGGGYGGGGFGTGGVPGVVNDDSRRRVEEALLGRLDTQYQQDEGRLRNQLLAQGLEVGTPAYAAELDRLGRMQNDARMQAVLAGGQEESRQTGLNAMLQQQGFQQGLQGAQFDNQTRQQMLSEMLTQRQLPFQELTAMRNLVGGNVQMPNFGSYFTANAQAGDVQGAGNQAANYAMNAWNNENQANNGLFGSLVTLGSAAMPFMLSDMRAKTNITYLGRHPSGVGRYKWDWKDGSGSEQGVLAQELAEVRPDAVVEGPGGLLHVNYDAIGGR